MGRGKKVGQGLRAAASLPLVQRPCSTPFYRRPHQTRTRSAGWLVCGCGSTELVRVGFGMTGPTDYECARLGLNLNTGLRV